MSQALERLAKWRNHFAAWQLGTRPKTDPEFQAVRNAQEARLIMRAEMTAVVGLLIAKGVFTQEEFLAELDKEADLLCMQLEDKWPGVYATDTGLTYDLKRVVEWMRDWKP